MRTLLTTALFLAVCISISALRPSQNHLLSSKNTFHLASSQDLTLSLDVAARDQGFGSSMFPLSVSYLNIYWNDVLVSKWSAPDYKIYHLQFKVTPKNGINNLTLSVVASTSTLAGSCFSNVSLKGADGIQLVVNGNINADFGIYGWSPYSTSNHLNGWNTLNQYGAGKGSIFNPRFTTNVIAIDNTVPSVYQTFDIKAMPELSNSQQLTLSLDVAARDQASGKFGLSTSYLNIHWNDVLVYKWTAPDYEIHHLQFKVIPKNGTNNISLSVIASTNAGSCFSNVSLKGKDGKQLIVNGGFFGDYRRAGWSQYTTTNNLIGWNTLNKYGAGLGSIFNPRFPSTVAAIDGWVPSLYQTLNIKVEDKNTLTLNLDVAARVKGSPGVAYTLQVSYLQIYWNDVLVSKWTPLDYEIQHFSFKLTPKNGTNTLYFWVPTWSTGGACFGNVSLMGKNGKELVFNGNFNGNFGLAKYAEYSTTKNLIGWNTKSKYWAGIGNIFNPRFTSNIVALDYTVSSIYQTFDINVLEQGSYSIQPNQKLTLSFDAAAREDLPLSWLEVYWNAVLILDWRPKDKEIRTFTFNVIPRQGLNTLEFGVSTVTKGGAVFKNVSLKGQITQENMVINGNFDENVVIGSQKNRIYDTANTINGWRTLRTFALGTNLYNKRFTKNLCVLDNTVPSVYQTFDIQFEPQNS